MQGIFEQLVHAAVFDGLAGVHDHNVVGDLRHNAKVVRDQDNRRAHTVLELGDQTQNLRLDRHVERSGRFVGDQDFRVARKRHRDHDALAHTAGELVRIFVDDALRRRDAHEREHLNGACARLLFRHALVQRQAFHNLLADGEHRV